MKNWNEISKREKLEIFTKIAIEKGITASAVEKDWWITETIHLIFQTRLSTHLILTGGTAFNRAWNLIEDFSTDIDLALDISFYGFNGLPTVSQLTTIQNRSFNYINEQFYPSLKQKFKDKELNVIINLNENDSNQNMLIIDIYYSSIVKYPKHIKSRILLKIDYKAQLKLHKLKFFSSLVQNQYPNTTSAGAPISIPCLDPEQVYTHSL